MPNPRTTSFVALRAALIAIGLFGTLAMATPSTAQNLLLNPGFESVTSGSPFDVPTDWNFFTLPAGGGSSNYYSIATGDPIFPGPETFTALEGSQGIGHFPESTGAENASIVYQQFPTTGGESFRLTGSAFVHPNQPLTNARTYARLDITFFDASFSSSATESSARIDLNTPQEQWTALAVEGTAPAWATQVQARIYLVECEGETSGCFDGGTVFWDDLSFGPAPPPVPFGTVTGVAGLLGSLVLVGASQARIRSRAAGS